MGKHTANTGTAANRSRLACANHTNNYMRQPKNMRRPLNRLADRRKYYNEVLSKSPRQSRYKKPGSLKARTN